MVGIVAGLVATLVGAGGVAGATGHPTVVARDVARTAGTKPVGYGSLAITVPRSWAVAYGDPCPRVDTVVIDPPSAVYYCPSVSSSVTTVFFSSVPIGTGGGAGGDVIHVHGLTVHVQPGSPSDATWDLPAVGVQIRAIGPRGVAVLHTLHPLR